MRKLETGHKIALATLVVSIVACIGACQAFGRDVLDVTGIPPRSVDTWTRPADGAVMVYVPAGEFLMGSTNEDIEAILAECSDCERDWFVGELPQHTVYLDAFWIDRMEVTNAQYGKCIEAGACEAPFFWDNDRYNAPDQPVVAVTWDDARAYAAWAGGRLPTEAEWEKAARGIDGRIYPWGDKFDGSLVSFCDANCFAEKAEDWDDGYADTAPVGSYLEGTSPYGALDMAGNVWEWTLSLWGKDSRNPEFKYPYDPEDGRENVEAGDEVLRVLRGGSFGNSRRAARCAYRYWYSPHYRNRHLGLRVVVVAPGGRWTLSFPPASHRPGGKKAIGDESSIGGLTE